MPPIPIAVGTIVSLKSHPLTKSANKIIISGEYQSLPPLMVVSEIVKDLRTTLETFDEHTGEKNVASLNHQYKCIWYSTKSFQYEEAILTSDVIAPVRTTIPNIKPEDLSIGATVSFKTLEVELGKQKSTLTIDGNSDGYSAASTITALLSFVSPIMYVLSVKKKEVKESLFDSKTGIQKKYVSQFEVKCKWFNPATDKMSEKILPLESLAIIPVVEQKLLNTINESIITKDYFLNIEISSRKTFFKPKRVSFRSGYYYVSGYDYLTNKIVEIEINEVGSSPNKVDKVFSEKAPSFNYISGKLSTETNLEEMEALINKAIGSKNYIRFKYKDRNDRLTMRTIKPESLKKDVMDEHGKKQTYIIGYCMMRKENRTFKLTAIQNLWLLDLSYDTK